MYNEAVFIYLCIKIEMMELEGAKILLVDDEGDILEFLEHVLSKAGAKVITESMGKKL